VLIYLKYRHHKNHEESMLFSLLSGFYKYLTSAALENVNLCELVKTDPEQVVRVIENLNANFHHYNAYQIMSLLKSNDDSLQGFFYHAYTHSQALNAATKLILDHFDAFKHIISDVWASDLYYLYRDNKITDKKYLIDWLTASNAEQQCLLNILFLQSALTREHCNQLQYSSEMNVDRKNERITNDKKLFITYLFDSVLKLDQLYLSEDDSSFQNIVNLVAGFEMNELMAHAMDYMDIRYKFYEHQQQKILNTRSPVDNMFFKKSNAPLTFLFITGVQDGIGDLIHCLNFYKFISGLPEYKHAQFIFLLNDHDSKGYYPTMQIRLPRMGRIHKIAAEYGATNVFCFSDVDIENADKLAAIFNPVIEHADFTSSISAACYTREIISKLNIPSIDFRFVEFDFAGNFEPIIKVGYTKERSNTTLMLEDKRTTDMSEQRAVQAQDEISSYYAYEKFSSLLKDSLLIPVYFQINKSKYRGIISLLSFNPTVPINKNVCLLSTGSYKLNNDNTLFTSDFFIEKKQSAQFRQLIIMNEWGDEVAIDMNPNAVHSLYVVELSRIPQNVYLQILESNPELPIMGTSGDTGLQTAISYGKLPFHACRDYLQQWGEQLINSEYGSVFTEQEKAVLISFLSRDLYFDYKDPQIEREVEAYASMDFPTLIAAWGKVCTILINDYNLFSALPKIIKTTLDEKQTAETAIRPK
jgi:hypothetical protein